MDQKNELGDHQKCNRIGDKFKTQIGDHQKWQKNIDEMEEEKRGQLASGANIFS
jgi:hypothetical protein